MGGNQFPASTGGDRVGGGVRLCGEVYRVAGGALCAGRGRMEKPESARCFDCGRVRGSHGAAVDDQERVVGAQPARSVLQSLVSKSICNRSIRGYLSTE